MNISTLFNKLSQLGVELKLNGDMLKIIASDGTLEQALLAELKKKKSDIIARFRELNITSNRQIEELSFSQQRLWLLDRLDQSTIQYNISVKINIKGPLDRCILEKCLIDCISRHHILRTKYVETSEGMPIQVVQENNSFQLGFKDITHFSESEKLDVIENICEKEANKAFNLSEDLMLRANLIQICNDLHSLILTTHHIASDGWSSAVICNEMSKSYESYVNTGENVLVSLKLQYADYARWQNDLLRGEAYDKQRIFWQDKLDNVPSVHNLPLDRQRKSNSLRKAGYYQQSIEPKLFERVKQLAHQHGSTPFMAFHAAFSSFLQRLSGDDDIIVGTPVSNRESPELEALVGFFTNMLVLRSNFSDDLSFNEALLRSKGYILGALEHQQMPFDKLVEELNPPRSNSYNPLVQVVLAYQSQYESTNTNLNKYSFVDLEMTQQSIDNPNAKFDLILTVIERKEGAALSWEYNADLFNEKTIVRMSGHFVEMLGNIVESPNDSLQSLPLISKEELQVRINDWNAVGIEHPTDLCIQDLFVKSVIETPDNIAVIDDEGQLTYLELFEYAIEVCNQVKSFNLTCETLVAVKLPKGRDQVIATLGIMMAGAAYLPLEVDWPDERCVDILNVANCNFIIVGQKECGPSANISIIKWSEAKESLERNELLYLAKTYKSPQCPTDLAYVIFTSGSTGKPKGVAIEHASAVNTILDINARYCVTSIDKVLAVSALSFDLSVYDLFGLLAVGGCIVFLCQEEAKNPFTWLRKVEQHGITIWNTVPVSASLLVEQLEIEGRKSDAPLRVIMMSGDWIAPSLPAKLWDHFSGCEVYSLGGATEGSIWSIHYPILSDTTALKSVPYGKPLSGQEFYILNENLQHCPVGVTGELHIGGKGVAREYYAQPELTANQFINHEKLDKRLYKTGDLGRYREDGVIEFMGRCDKQLKIRGFRIEPGEIETHIKEFDGISEALVIANEDVREHSILVAYYINESSAICEQMLEEFLRERLPSYMLPSAYVSLEKLPLTSNGKLDRKSLPKPQRARLFNVDSEEKTETQAAICSMVGHLLHMENVSINSNLFSLGGGSLLVIQLIFQIKKQYGIELPSQDVFIADNLEQIAKIVDEKVVLHNNKSIALSSEYSEMEW